MTKLIRIASLVLLSLASFSVFGVKLTDLYQAEIPVPTQSAEDRAAAVKQGLTQVLTKLSGAQIEKNSVIKSSLQKADYYVQEYRYISSPSPSQYLLQVRYNTNDLNRLLKKAGANYWGETRPLILVWVTLANQGRSAEIISNGSPDNIQDLMNQQGKKFGLPLIFPIMDVVDVGKVSADDINALSIPVLKEAGKRYAPDAYLVGSLEQNGNDLETKWHLLLGENQWDWNINGKSIDTVLTELLNQVSTALSNRYVVKTTTTAPMWIKLEISNVTERTDLGELMRYLKQLSPVQQVRLSQVSGDIVEVSILTRGTVTTFQQNATLGQRLVLKSQDDVSNKLFYEWAH